MRLCETTLHKRPHVNHDITDLISGRHWRFVFIRFGLPAYLLVTMTSQVLELHNVSEWSYWRYNR